MRGLTDRLYQTLVDEQQHRAERPWPQWRDAERLAMLQAVNAERAASGAEPVAAGDIERAEWDASGAFDYTRTFAINCARLVQR